MEIKTEDALKLVRAASIKTAPLAVGQKVELVGDIVKRDITVKQNNEDVVLNADYVVATIEGKSVTIPLTELVNNFRFQSNDDTPVSFLELGGEKSKKIEIPTSFVVKEAEERVSNGKPMYGLANYLGFESVTNGVMSYNQFMETDPSPKEGAKPMCTYVVAL